MPNIGPLELIVVLVIALVILGPKKLPQMGHSVGKGMREFKDAISGDKDHSEDQRQLAALHAEHAEETREAVRAARSE
jgi:sec-independent protein translocase protein TatA